MLYVPELSCNLVSVSKATEAGLSVNFDSDKCTFFDKVRNLLAATGNKKGSLWYLNCLENEIERVSAAVSEEKMEDNRAVDIEQSTPKPEVHENQEIKTKEEPPSPSSEIPVPNQEECAVIRETKKKSNPEESKKQFPVIVEENLKVTVETKEENENKIAEVNEEPKSSKITRKTSSNLWHSRYGHLGVQNMRKLCQRHLVKGFNYDLTSNQEFCEPCVKGKHHHQKFPTEGGKRAKDKLELVHTDVCGKVESKSLSGCEYFLSFIDDMSRYSWCYPLKKKSDVYQKFIEWKTMVERSSDRSLKKIRSDNGGEYTSEQFAEHLHQEGITHQLTIPKTPQQNGVAERLNRTLEETIRSMLAESQAPKHFWAEALSTATYLRNRSPTIALDNVTPYEAWTGDKPNVEHLRVFGCTAYAHIPKDERKKLDPKARKCIMLGYGTEVKGYRLYNPETQRILYSRDVIFNETEFYFKDKSKKSEVERNEKSEGPYSEIPLVRESEDENEAEENPETDTEVEDTSRPVRNRNAPDRYGEWVYTAAEIEPKDPKSYQEAMKNENSEKWNQAMKTEMKSLDKNEVWDLVPLPEGRKAIGCKWVYKTKRNADGKIERYKARLVAQGFTQKFGIDYDETFSPVIRFESVRTIIAIAASLGLNLHQMDIKTAFLNGELKEEIYMRQPPGFAEPGKENLVCKLKRSLYGLKQSARCWNTELDNKLKLMGFSQTTSDPCLYVRVDQDGVFIMAVYVDDIILAGENSTTMSKAKSDIFDRFDAEDMGELHHFLGVKVVQNINTGEIWIGQPTYSRDLLEKFNMSHSNPTDTPVDVGAKLMKRQEGEDSFDHGIYQSAVGSLLYLSTKTRPDLAFAVGNVARYCADPTKVHWTAVKRIIRYVKGTLNMGLLFCPDNNINLEGYSDADWAGDKDDRRSTSGYVFQIGNAAISWRSKKQSCVALSTAESEYMALSSAIQEAIWLRRLIANLLNSKDMLMNPTIIHEDNNSAIFMAKNNQYHDRTKHIDIKFHFVREQVAAGTVDLRYCKSKDMLADIFTKGLCGPQFKKLRSRMGLVEFK